MGDDGEILTFMVFECCFSFQSPEVGICRVSVQGPVRPRWASLLTADGDTVNRRDNTRPLIPK